MSTIKSVVITFEDKVMTVTGEQAAKWQKHNAIVSEFASVHNYNPFDSDPIQWEIDQIVSKNTESIKQVENKPEEIKPVEDPKQVIPEIAPTEPTNPLDETTIKQEPVKKSTKAGK